MSDPAIAKSRSSGLAFALGLLIPGSGHVYMGRYVIGLLIFAGVTGCYFMGILFLGEPSVPLVVAFVLLLVGALIHWNTARKAYWLGVDPKGHAVGILGAISG